ncbi:MAG: DUF2934 domain-containing protein [Hyphomicrobiales bacterium]|nr:DUF2934 domain-containing protein [Hyphomicrobiales bacterium]MBV9426332.1 DUF2934 domain-containing protein [Bradyrhizobiaceae bacterium]
MSEREQQVRAIAHRLWEEEGRPTDQEERHWATAERMLDAQERASSAGSNAKRPHEEAQTASPVTTGRRRARTSTKRTPTGAHTSVTH